jgi:DNA-binding CsgD family transcriptional regulator
MNQLPDPDIVVSRYHPAHEEHEKALPVMLERALDMLDCALLIVDDEGKVEYRNRVASALVARSHGGLALGGGILTAKGRKLRDALAEAIRLACVELQSSGLCLSQPGSPPERWLRLVVAPIYFGTAGGRGGRAAIWILNTETPAVPSEELLSALFGLSRAEARLALGMLAGRSAAECARLAGVGLATIRTQLHSIFTKTGVRRQAQLVALLSKVPVLQLGGKT